ncbi:MAG TPA: sigma-70 family RNA polymerase sigma factor [Bacillota bacterium]|nr:sigma-70 family RNA polymerase sigma factor [Bacillota bacterium]HPL54516.1 sigma-70 family RNA polymerase sigma factor [Bacillota bacterium]
MSLIASDIEIVNQCLAGDVNAFEALIERYKRAVYNTAYRMMGNREEAEDVSQEAFIRMYNSLSRYNPEYKFITWALKITTNLCLDNLRKRKAETVPIDEWFEIKDEKDTPEEEYIRKESQRLVQDAIMKLPDKYREFLILFHHRNLSYQEIMDVTGESLTIVKNRLYRARQMLKEELINRKKERIEYAVQGNK